MKRLIYKFFIFVFNTMFNVIHLSIIRKILLCMVGAKIGKNFTITGFCRFDFPWRLEIGDNCYVTSSYFDCRGAGIKIGNNSDISENSKIFTLSHNIYSKEFETISKKVVIHQKVWIAANCVVLPGSILNNGCVISANSVVKGNIQKFSLYSGNYAKKIKNLPKQRAKLLRR